MSEQKTKKRLSNLKHKSFKNSLIILFLIVFFSGYAIFFTSPLYMANVGNLKHTDFSEVVTLENREIQLLYWAYSKEQKRMEIELQIDNKSFDGRDSYNFSAVLRPTNKAVKITKVLEEPNYVVIQIDGIPKNFREISLRMEVENSPSEQIRLYSNVEQVTQVEKIEPGSQLQYHIRRLERNITNYNNKITALDNDIQARKNKIANIQSANLLLEQNKQYQTTAEIEITNQNIKENLNAISDLEKEIAGLEQELREQQNLIEQSKERLKELEK